MRRVSPERTAAIRMIGVVYVERAPSAVLRPWVRSLWYCCAPTLGHTRERVLPNGCMQMLVNLAHDSTTECAEDGLAVRRTARALMMGARRRFEVVATEDLEG